MSLPDLIEIRPLSAPVKAEIVVPGSKSITNRALVLAALACNFLTGPSQPTGTPGEAATPDLHPTQFTAAASSGVSVAPDMPASTDQLVCRC